MTLLIDNMFLFYKYAQLFVAKIERCSLQARTFSCLHEKIIIFHKPNDITMDCFHYNSCMALDYKIFLSNWIHLCEFVCQRLNIHKKTGNLSERQQFYISWNVGKTINIFWRLMANYCQLSCLMKIAAFAIPPFSPS